MIYHTVIRIVSKDRLVSYKRLEDEEYEDANYYERYYSDTYSYPDNHEVVVVNQFVTEEVSWDNK